MKLGYSIVIAVLLACGLASAQEVTQKSKSKISVKDGKTVTVTGCVGRSADGGFTLTHVTGKEGELSSYVLAPEGDDEADDLAEQVGHRVEITGKAADKGEGKLQVETKTEGTTGKRESTSEVKGDLSGLPFLGVDSVKMLATVCP